MSAPNKKPWPMKWIVVAILVCIVPYTWLTVRYRKADKPFEPYVDMKNEANVIRLLAHGYQRVTAPAERLETPPSPPAADAARATAAPAGYPTKLAEALADPPALPLGYRTVAAPAATKAGEPFAIAFTCRLPDDHHVVAGMELYVKDGQLALVPAFESVGGLSTRTRDFSARITVPGHLLPAGTYQVLLPGSEASLGWTLQVH